MSNGVHHDLEMLLRAKYPVLAVLSKEELRVERAIRQVAERLTTPFAIRHWSVTTGITKADGEAVNDETREIAAALDYVQKTPERALYVFRDAHPYIDDPFTRRKLRDTARLLKQTPPSEARAIILLSPSLTLPPDLEADVHMMEWPLPTREEIARVLEELVKSIPANPPDVRRAVESADRERIVSAALGLTAEEAYAAFSRSVVERHALDAALILQEKKQIVAKSGILEWMEAWRDGVGGLENLKAWLEQRRAAFTAEAREYGLPRPRGVFLAGQPGCLRGDARVLLADGRMPTFESLARQVSDCLEPGQYEVAIRVQLEDGSSALATHLQIHANRETVIIECADGREVEATSDHELLTPNGWVSAGEIKSGDAIVLWRGPSATATPPKRTMFDRPLHSVRRRHHPVDTLPEVWTTELCEFLGLLAAEGSKDSYRTQLAIGLSEGELAEWVRLRCEKLFGLKPAESTIPGKRVLIFRLNSFDVAVNIHPLLRGGARQRRVPGPVFELEEACIAAFLRGLFEGDGTVTYADTPAGSRKAPSVSLKTASRGLAQDVQLLLQRLGIPSRIACDATTDCFTVVVSTATSLRRFAELVGFLVEPKCRRLARACQRFCRTTRNRFAVAATVKAVRASALDRVYDLTVPGAGRFIANGLVVHNCGKSLTAKAIAAAWDMPPLRLSVAACFGSLVGESEAKLRKALTIAEVVAPCVLLIDEIDKAVGAGGAEMDGGTTSRVRGELLTWLQERKSDVFVVAAANNVEDLAQRAPELLRKGRWDEIFFVDLPNVVERQQILEVHLRRRKLHLSAAKLGRVVEATTDFSGAELEAVVTDAMFRAFADGRRPVRETDLLEEAKRTVPMAKSSSGRITALREWAKGKARPASVTQQTVAGRAMLEVS